MQNLCRAPRIPYRRANDCFTLRVILNSIQAGLCAICQGDHTLVLDHDHKTGLTRGLLCNKCNGLLGFANDTLGLLERAIVYLRMFNQTAYRPISQSIPLVSRNSPLFLKNRCYLTINP